MKSLFATLILFFVVVDARISIDACMAKDLEMRQSLQIKLAEMGIECENMCKKMDIYPKCQCPGFAGQPANDNDYRACTLKHCQDPVNKCPTDAFVRCVRETTRVSTLQWP